MSVHQFLNAGVVYQGIPYIQVLNKQYTFADITFLAERDECYVMPSEEVIKKL